MAKQKTVERTAILSCLTRMKSVIDSSRKSIAFFNSMYTKFCEETTLHGLKHTVTKDLHYIERLLWFALTMVAFTGAVYCALSQLARYNSEPVVVSLQRDYRRWSSAFPAVTACLLERVEQEKAKEAIERHWNVTEDSDSEKFQYYQEFVSFIAEISFRNNIQNFWKYQGDESLNKIDLLQLAISVHPDFPLKVTVSQHNLEVKWVPVMTEEGLCMTFNSEYAQFQRIDDVPWQSQDLMKCHYHIEFCYVKIEAANGVRYFVHSPYDIATAISNPTGEIYPGDELNTDFKVVEIQAADRIKSLRPEQRRCKYPDEWLGDSIKAYSFGLCQMNCRSKMAVMFCGCRPYFHVKGDGDVCDTDGMACIGRNVEILINLPKNLAKCSCIPQCAELNYYSHTKKVNVHKKAVPLTMQNITYNKNSIDSYMNEMNDDQGAVVKFTLMPPKFRLHRDIIFSLDDLIASLGGTTALFVGASVLTVVETALFIIRFTVSHIMEKLHEKTLVFKN